MVLRLGRINRYFENLIDSFDVMVDGMEKAAVSALPHCRLDAGLGLQSVQYRLHRNCQHGPRKPRRPSRAPAACSAMPDPRRSCMGCIYWQAGATGGRHRRQGPHPNRV
ncbi:MAG: hypothetical protein WKG07_04720 [Hymenobacter sp.]